MLSATVVRTTAALCDDSTNRSSPPLIALSDAWAQNAPLPSCTRRTRAVDSVGTPAANRTPTEAVERNVVSDTPEVRKPVRRLTMTRTHSRLLPVVLPAASAMGTGALATAATRPSPSAPRRLTSVGAKPAAGACTSRDKKVSSANALVAVLYQPSRLSGAVGSGASNSVSDTAGKSTIVALPSADEMNAVGHGGPCALVRTRTARTENKAVPSATLSMTRVPARTRRSPVTADQSKPDVEAAAAAEGVPDTTVHTPWVCTSGRLNAMLRF